MAEPRPRLWLSRRVLSHSQPFPLGCLVLVMLAGMTLLGTPARMALAQAQEFTDRAGDANSGGGTPDITGLQLAAALENVITGVIARSEKSIVAIARVEPTGDDRQTPINPDFIPHDFGTGVVVDRGGLILTQYHLVQEGHDHWVTTADRKIYKAQPVAADPRSGLAVLRVPASDLVPMTLGDAAQVRKGQFVVALGNPFAIARDGQASASWGIIANIARKAGPLPDQDGSLTRKDTLHHFGTLLQTDAKLNLGTSGGALLNLRGQMIGLTTNLAATAGYESSAGYAVPVDATFRRVVETLKQGREVEYGLLGIRTNHLEPSEVRLGLRGMRVYTVYGGTPAARGEVQADDVITHVNGVEIFGPDGLMLEVGRLSPEEKAELTVVRQGRVLKLKTELTKNYVPGKKLVTAPRPQWRGIHVDYATAIRDFADRLIRREVDVDGCVVVTSVEPDSPAWKEGLRENMFISHVNGARVTTPQALFAAVSGKEGPVSLQLTLPPDQRPLRTIAAAKPAAEE